MASADSVGKYVAAGVHDGLWRESGGEKEVFGELVGIYRLDGGGGEASRTGR